MGAHVTPPCLYCSTNSGNGTVLNGVNPDCSESVVSQLTLQVCNVIHFIFIVLSYTLSKSCILFALSTCRRMDTNARLGRGKSYANTGKVLSINVTGPKVILVLNSIYRKEDLFVYFLTC